MKKCKNGAYFKVDERYLCGVHSRNLKREKLPKATLDEKTETKDLSYQKMLTSAKTFAEINKKNNGKVILQRLKGRFSKLEPLEGYLDVYPNGMATYQGIGLVLPKLSPMIIGPINHGQIDLPPAKNLENFHQFSKFYSKLESKEEFKISQIKGFNDPIPHRRKFSSSSVRPDYFVWIDNKEGKEVHLDYFTSRQFYCNFYQRGIQKSKELKQLIDLLNDGYNLRICGPDAHPLKGGSFESYLDTSVPRGHEFCLYEILTNTKGDYPWLKFKTFDF